MKMVATSENGDARWSEKKMDESDAWLTVECLRGRLIAERTASKTSRDEAEQLENKVMELEGKVKEEIKSRNRVEKKLRFLMKKLENLNISYISDQQVSSSNNSFSSISSSSSSSSSPNHKKLGEMIDEPKIQIMTTTSTASPQTSEISTMSTRSSFASIKDNLETELESKDFSSSTDSITSKVKEKDDSDNSMAMALVLVVSSKAEQQQSSSIDYVSGNVKDALDALKHAREKIQSSMEMKKKRIMMKVESQLENL